MNTAVLRALGNTVSGFAGALILGVNLYGFLLGLGICVVFNAVVSILTDRKFAKDCWEVLRVIFYFLWHLILPFLLLAAAAFAFWVVAAVCYGIYRLCQTVIGEIVFVILVLAAIVFMIVYAAMPDKNRKK